MRAAYKCPSCRKEVERIGPCFPFCSPRCRDVDLGRWLLEAYRVSRPVRDDDEELLAGEEPAAGSPED
jgi:hypothetical protein